MARIVGEGRPVLVDSAIDYDRKTWFTRGIVKTNLARLPWPERMEGARQAGGRLIMVDTNDSLDASRLLHPELHRLLSGPLGSPFYAGPERQHPGCFFGGR